MNRMSISITPVGIVRSPIQDIYHHGYRDVVSEIVINPELEEGLEGIEGFSHLEVFFYFHRLERDRISLKRRPRDRQNAPEVGIFAIRTQLRPSAIGATVVRLLEHSGNVLRVQGLDAIDGTPVLDIKPYTAHEAVSPEDLRFPSWYEKIRAAEQECPPDLWSCTK